MKIVTWKNEYKPNGYDWTIQTDCRDDRGIESTYNRLLKIVQNNNGKIPAKEVEKLINNLKMRYSGPKGTYSEKYGYNRPTRQDEEIYDKKRSLKAAEYYCMGKLMTGETEDKYRNSGVLEPLKDYMTKDYDWIGEVTKRITDYYGSMATSHAELKKNPLSAIYEPGVFGAHSDTTKKNAFDVKYVSDDYEKDLSSIKQSFEDEISAADISKYRTTAKDRERVENLYDRDGNIIYGKASTMIKATKDMNKLIARFIYSVQLPRAKRPLWSFAEKAMEEGAITKAQLEALTRKITGKSIYSMDMDYNGTSSIKRDVRDLDESIFEAILDEATMILARTRAPKTLRESRTAIKNIILETCKKWNKVSHFNVEKVARKVYETLAR